MTWRFLAARSLSLYLFPALFLSIAIASATTKKPPLRPININTANAEELQLVPGIGPVTAEKILQMRKSYGPFKSVDDLVAIRGIGKKRLDKMRKYLTVGKTAGPKSTQPQTPSPAKAAPSPVAEPAATSEPPFTIPR
jgi:comEA protein